MKKGKRLLALALALAFAALALTACGKKDEGDEGEVENKNIAAQGGSIEWPEGMDTTVRFNTQIEGDTLYAVFNGIQNRTTAYFTPAASSVTITSKATTESEKRVEYRVTLWKESYGAREYVTDGTMYFTADGSCYTGTFSGLEPGNRYKLGIAYDGGSYYISGGLTVGGLAQADNLDDDDSGAAA